MWWPLLYCYFWQWGVHKCDKWRCTVIKIQHSNYTLNVRVQNSRVSSLSMPIASAKLKQSIIWTWWHLRNWWRITKSKLSNELECRGIYLRNDVQYINRYIDHGGRRLISVGSLRLAPITCILSVLIHWTALILQHEHACPLLLVWPAEQCQSTCNRHSMTEWWA